MPNSPFQPLFGKGVDIEKVIERATTPVQPPMEEEAIAPQPSPSPPQPQTKKTQIPASLKQKALSSLGELALFVDKRKNIFIIVIIILILIAVIIVAKQQRQQRKKLKMMRRKLKRLTA